jgi:hypothetical protein
VVTDWCHVVCSGGYVTGDRLVVCSGVYVAGDRMVLCSVGYVSGDRMVLCCGGYVFYVTAFVSLLILLNH